MAISFCDNDDIAHLRDIEKLISQKIEVIENHPFPKTNVIPSNREKAVAAKAGGGRGRGSSDPRFTKAPRNDRFSTPKKEGYSQGKPRTSERVHGADKVAPSRNPAGSYTRPSTPGNRPSGPKGSGAKKGYYGGK